MKSPRYDALIIGSGFGGSAAAHALAQAGLKTILLERGGWAKRDDGDWDQRKILLEQRYRSASPLLVRQYNDRKFEPVYPNEAVGGMSVFYGGASLRLRENDFDKWPIEYTDLEEYYCKSERLLGVHGESGEDVCEPPRSQDYPFGSIELSPPAQRIRAAARKIGYRPGRIPLAINFADRTRPFCIRCNTCDGFPCKIEAKNDLTATVLREAQGFGLEIMAGAMATKLLEKKGRIKSVECIDKESRRPFSLSAGIVLVCAGALHSPAILLRSKLEGEKNRELVGRYLMRHCNAVVGSVFARRTNPQNTFHKQLCFTEFYEDLREKLGTAAGIIQDIYTPAPEVIGHHAPRGLKKLSGLVARHMQNLLCIAEDDPQYDNGVTLAGGKDVYGVEKIQISHKYTRNDRERLNHLMGKARRVLRAAGGVIPYTYAINSFSHAVGTLRFGHSPGQSVLDEHCRLWGLDNLFVLDGSFMPTSGGVNPSLTIAANAFRVSDHIVSHSGML